MGLFLIFVSLAIVGLIHVGVQILAVRSYLHKNSNAVPGPDIRTGEKGAFHNTEYSAAYQSSEMFHPPISILKPLKGLDDSLFSNLESFCNQNYPEYEIIFSLQDEDDPALKLATKVKEKYPHKHITIVVEKCNYGLNPKVNNLVPAYRVSHFQYVLISDSNIMVDTNYLIETIRHMKDPDVGLVTNLIRGVGSRSIGSILENLHLNSFVIGNVCVLNKFFKIPCVVGKSMLMRKCDFEQIGGFEAIKDILAEDYLIGRWMHQRGKRVITSNYIIDSVNQYRSVEKFLNRHTRWGKMGWQVAGIKYFAEILSNAVFISCLSLVVLGPTQLAALFAVTVSLFKILGDCYLGKSIGSTHHIFHYLLSPIKDIIMGLIWFVPFFSRRVTWRGNKYKLGQGSVLFPNKT